MLLVLAACNGGKPAAVSVPPDAAAPPACASHVSVSASIAGSWFGDRTNGALPEARLAVQVDDRSLGPPERLEVARLPIAKPFFDADVKLDELCSDEGSSADAIDVRCVGGSRISRLVVRRAGRGLDASVDGGPAQHWTLPSANACWDLRGLGEKHDLEPARVAWGRDAPSPRCADAPRVRPVRVAIDFLAPRERQPCEAGDKLLSAYEVVVSAGAGRKDLGVMANFCAGLHPLRYTDADALLLQTSDMGTEYREVYRLGDRLYVVEEGSRITSSDLPCGAKVAFDVRYPRKDLVIDETPRPIR